MPRPSVYYLVYCCVAEYNSEDNLSTGSSIPSIEEEEEEEEEPVISNGRGPLGMPYQVATVSVNSNSDDGETVQPATSVTPVAPVTSVTPQALVNARSGRDIVKGLQTRKRKKQGEVILRTTAPYSHPHVPTLTSHILFS